MVNEENEKIGTAMAVKYCLDHEVPLHNITVSSDGNGSYSSYDEAGRIIEIGVSSLESLLSTFNHLIKLDIPIETALRFFTSNVAETLGVYPMKGSISEGADADLLLVDKNLKIERVFVKGKEGFVNGKAIIKGMYE